MNNDPASRSAPTVIFVHGVSLDPRLFGATARSLRHRGRTWTRPGYGGSPAARSFDEQVERLVEHLATVGPCVVAGVSGGATVALAAAIAAPDAMAGIVSHEPLIGALEPELDARIGIAAESLERDGSPDAIERFLRRLYGEAWDARPDKSVRWSDDHVRHVPADVAQFASFAPTLDDLDSIVARHTTTVGSRSLPERHRVAATLGAIGACPAVIADSGHLVLADNPVSLAAIVDGVADRCVAP